MDKPRNPRFIDLTSHQFTRWTVISYEGRTGQNNLWLCECACGVAATVQGSNLTSGKSRSCGCLHRESVSRRNARHLNRVHGKTTTEYRIWCNIKQRCLNPNNPNYYRYGGRGITICDRWRDSFEAFLADVGFRPSRKHSIDRENNERGYEPGNVRWATQREQMENTRRTRLVEWCGRQMAASEAARIAGLPVHTFYWRLRAGWPLERAMTEPQRGQ